MNFCSSHMVYIGGIMTIITSSKYSPLPLLFFQWNIAASCPKMVDHAIFVNDVEYCSRFPLHIRHCFKMSSLQFHFQFGNLSSPDIWWNICKYNSLQNILSVTARCWKMCSLYAFKCKRFRNSCHTVTFGIHCKALFEAPCIISGSRIDP
jgi:hypothetical protein